jgi:carboxyl-terminal processing protease
MSPGTQENFAIGMRLQLDGIGAQLKGEDGYTTIMELTPGGAADRDGRLKKKDRVVGVGQGTDGEIVDVVDMNLNEVVKLIRGKRGTIVRLKVIPVGETAPRVYDITRAKIELKDAEARGEVIEHGRKADGGPYKVGVINLPSFYMDMAGAQQGQAEFKSSTRDCKRILEDFRRQDVDCVVLDLRSNGGGSLPEAIKLTGLFIGAGRADQGFQQAGAALRRRRRGSCLGRALDRPHEQVQRQRERDPRRRDPGLPPRPDRGRQVDPRQGNRADAPRRRPDAVRPLQRASEARGHQGDDPAVLPAVG